MAKTSPIDLFIDDLRQPPRGWKLARTNDEAIEILSAGGVREVSIDHNIMTVGYSQQDEETFMPTASYIAGMPEGKRPRMVTIHTSNSVGASRMTKLFRQAGVPCRRGVK
jgi:hypothetical protein